MIEVERFSSNQIVSLNFGVVCWNLMHQRERGRIYSISECVRCSICAVVRSCSISDVRGMSERSKTSLESTTWSVPSKKQTENEMRRSSVLHVLVIQIVVITVTSDECNRLPIIQPSQWFRKIGNLKIRIFENTYILYIYIDILYLLLIDTLSS